MLKLITFFSVALLSLSGHAQSWAKRVQTCDEALVEDICWFNGVKNQCRRQLLVTGDHAKRFLVGRGIVFLSQQNEVLLPSLQTIYDSNDLKDESAAYMSGGRVYYVKPGGEDLKLEAFRTTQWTGGSYSQQEKVGEYIFRDCRYN